MTEQQIIDLSKQHALEILAYLKRAHGAEFPEGTATNIAERIHEAITTATDAQLGTLRNLAQILGRAQGDSATTDAALETLSKAGIEYEP